MWLTYPVKLHWRKIVFLLTAILIADSFFIRGGRQCPLPPFCACVLCITWSCARFVHDITISVSTHVHQFYCAGKKQFCWNNVPSQPFIIFFLPVPHRYLSLEGKTLMKTSIEDWVLQSLFISACWVAQLWILMLVFIYNIKKLLWGGLSKSLM